MCDSVPTFRPPISKSLFQRKLLLEAVHCIESGEAWRVADSDTLPCDCRVMLRALEAVICGHESVNVADNGTAIRFITILLAAQGKQCAVGGSARLMERPARETLDAARQLREIVGGRISYSAVSVSATETSQHISALLLVAPMLPDGLRVNITGNAVSRPYISLTTSLMRSLRLAVEDTPTGYFVPRQNVPEQDFSSTEADWSSAAYAYEAMLAGTAGPILIEGLRLLSPQPDAAIAAICNRLGIKSLQTDAGVQISQEGVIVTRREKLLLDASKYPDIVAPLAVGLALAGQPYAVTNATYLRGKESDRIEALRCGLRQLGFAAQWDGGTFYCDGVQHGRQNSVVIETQGDHRIAMAFAVAAKKHGITLDNTQCVSKSFPDFWKQCKIFA